MRTITLNGVARKAMNDPVFWRSLRKDAKAALRERKLELDPGDARRLEAILALDGKTLAVDRRTFRVDLDSVMKEARRGGRAGFGGLTWIGMWHDLLR